jgi:hypothetical protein
MASIEISLSKDPTAITVVANLAEGWGQWQYGYGFFGRGFLDRGGWRLAVDVQVRARPNRRAHLARTFPANLRAFEGNEALYYKLSGPTLEIHAELEPNLVTLHGASKPGINWRPDNPIKMGGHVGLYVTLLVVFNSSEGIPPRRDIIERDLLPFLSGGQSESNRRRH